MEEPLVFNQETGRVLAPMERMLYWWVVAYRGPILSHEIIFDSSKVIKKSQVSHAFEILMRRQTAMQMRIVADSADPSILRFKSMETLLPLNLNFRRITDENPLCLIDEEIGKPVDVTNGPLWRATFARIDRETEKELSHSTKMTYAIVFTCHHSICDGMSCFDLLGRQFLPLISDIVSAKHVSPGDYVIPQCEAWENAVLQIKSNEESARDETSVLKPEELKEEAAENASSIMDVKLTFPKEEIPDDLQKPYLTSFSLNQEAMVAILDKARAHGVKAHSVLVTAASVSFSQTSRAARVKLPDKLRFSWFINLRRFVDMKSPVPLGCYTGFTQTETPDINECSGETFWEICKQVHLHVVKGTSLKECSGEHGVEELVRLAQSSPHGESSRKALGLFRQPSVSNLGVCKQSGDTSIIRLKEYYRSEWFDGPDAATPSFFHGIATVGGCLYWTATVNAKVVGKHFMNEHMKLIKEVLMKYCVDE